MPFWMWGVLTYGREGENASREIEGIDQRRNFMSISQMLTEPLGGGGEGVGQVSSW